MDGVLVVDKPAGMTSHDVVDAVRRRLGTRKVGHAGTLDPDATGLLVLGVGAATRLLELTSHVPKRYVARACFGVTTSTQDGSGEIVGESPARHLTSDAVMAALAEFRGEIEQIPPMVSAVKVGGERLYKKARRGEEVERPTRTVTIPDLRLRDFTPGDRPQATFDVTCSSGTYIRTLVHDIGRALATGAHLTELRRVEAAGFTEDDAVMLDEVSTAALRPARELVRSLPRVEIDASADAMVRNGRALPLTVAAKPPIEGEPVAILSGGDLRAIYARRGDELVARKVIPR